MGASISRLQRAGGDRKAAIAGLLSDPSPVVAAAKTKYANDPAGLQTWIDQKINETTKGKYHGVIGKIGKVVSTVAPIAALAIPGLGPLAAAGIAAGGRAAGRALQGKSFDLGDTLKSGAVGGAGNLALGGQGVNRVRSLIGGAPAAAGTAAAAGGGKGILGGITDYVTHHPLDAAQIALAGYGTVAGAKSAGQADQLRQRALNSVNPNATIDFGLPGADPFDPYSQQQPSNRARRMALASLAN